MMTRNQIGAYGAFENFLYKGPELLIYNKTYQRQEYPTEFGSTKLGRSLSSDDLGGERL